MRKVLSLLLSLLLVAAMFIPASVSAEQSVINPEVLTSITEEEETGLGVAFLYTMNMQDVTLVPETIRTFKSATATIGGEDYRVLRMGAVVSNVEETGTDPNAMVLENVTGLHLLNVEGKKLWNWDETSCSYAIRITNIPVEYKKTQIYARPYYVYRDANGDEKVVYGDIANKSYFSGWCDTQPAVTLPTIGEDIDVTKKKGRIFVSDVSIVDRTVSLTVTNKSTNWITEETDYITLRCTNSAGKKISDIKIYIGCIDTKKNKTKTFTFDVPDETKKVRLYASSITYWTEWS